jgi:hypothetical protein
MNAIFVYVLCMDAHVMIYLSKLLLENANDEFIMFLLNSFNVIIITMSHPKRPNERIRRHKE